MPVRVRESSTGEGAVAFSAAQSVVAYFAFKPCSLATAAMVFFPSCNASRSFRSAATYFSTGSLPPAFVSNLMPCKFTAVAPPCSLNCA